MIKKFLAPDGAEIIGTLQTVQAVAMIEGVEAVTGDPIYTGDSTIAWETMQTVLKRTSVIYVDDRGRHWTLQELHQEGGDVNGYARRRAEQNASKRVRRLLRADHEQSEVSSSGG